MTVAPKSICHVCGGDIPFGSHSLVIEGVLVFGAAHPITLMVETYYTDHPSIPYLCEGCLVVAVRTGIKQLEEGLAD